MLEQRGQEAATTSTAAAHRASVGGNQRFPQCHLRSRRGRQRSHRIRRKAPRPRRQVHLHPRSHGGNPRPRFPPQTLFPASLYSTPYFYLKILVVMHCQG